MLNVKQRLQFSDLFAEKQEEILFYLKKISKDTLLKIIGFSTTVPQSNFDNIFSNPVLQMDINNRVMFYVMKNRVVSKPEVISRQVSLKLAEFILSNKEELFENEREWSVDDDEMNLLKAFLVINSGLNANNTKIVAEDNFEKLVEMTITTIFPVADLGLGENTDIEFFKILYSTIIKVENLIEFLTSMDELNLLSQGLYESFNVGSREVFLAQMKYFFGKILELKISNNYLFKVEDEDSVKFIESLITENLASDDDFTHLKNSPLYRVDRNVFSVIDYFFAIDKFYKSVKFKLKEIYEGKEELIKKGDFFSFFNLEFSEKYLMKNILDDIFDKPYFVKKESKDIEEDNEPDYYIRYSNNIYIFENKDNLIAKDIKVSGDIEKIDAVLKRNFLDKNKGITQLVNRIVEIIDQKFLFDKYVNTRKNLNVYPILIVHDRIFDIPGLNYRLNQWYVEKIVTQLGDKYKSQFIKNLVVIDIDTLIYWSPYLREKEKYFRSILDDHLRKMTTRKKINHKNYQIAKMLANKALIEQIAPISSRLPDYKFPTQIFINKFKEILVAE